MHGFHVFDITPNTKNALILDTLTRIKQTVWIVVGVRRSHETWITTFFTTILHQSGEIVTSRTVRLHI
jgi:hypothetical protein